MLEIHFRGPILYVRNNQQNTFPLALMPFGDSKIGLHPDETKAVPHYARAGLFNGDVHDTGSPIKLLGCEVTISDGSGTQCTSPTNLEELVYLRRVTNSGANDLTLNQAVTLGRELATAVRFEGGRLVAGTNSVLEWELTKDFNPNHGYPRRQLPLAVTWQTDAEAVTIRITGAVNETIQLYNGSRPTYIYNYDNPQPLRSRLDNEDRFQPGPLEDDDFKWLYRLLTPPTSWGKWLFGKHLPAPLSFCEPPAEDASTFKTLTAEGEPFPLISGCFAAVWDE